MFLLVLLISIFPELTPFLPFIRIGLAAFEAVEIYIKVKKVLNNKELVAKIEADFPELTSTLEFLGSHLFGLSGQAAREAGAQVFFHRNSTAWMQNFLNERGYHGGELLVVDGIYGLKTKAAVERYQKAHPPLDEDGWCGPITWGVMWNDAAVS